MNTRQSARQNRLRAIIAMSQEESPEEDLAGAFVNLEEDSNRLLDETGRRAPTRRWKDLHPTLEKRLAEKEWRPNAWQQIMWPYGTLRSGGLLWGEAGSGRTTFGALTALNHALGDEEGRYGWSLLVTPHPEAVRSLLADLTKGVPDAPAIDSTKGSGRTGVVVTTMSETASLGAQRWRTVVCDDLSGDDADALEALLTQVEGFGPTYLLSARNEPALRAVLFARGNGRRYLGPNDHEVLEQVEQQALICEIPDKLAVTVQALQQAAGKRAIIYTSGQRTATWLSERLTEQKIPCELVLGLRSEERLELTEKERSGSFQAVVTVDGCNYIAFPEPTFVIHFDIPENAFAYLNRLAAASSPERPARSLALVCDEYGLNYAGLTKALGERLPKPLWAEVNPDEVFTTAPTPMNFADFPAPDRDRRGGRFDRDRDRGRGDRDRSDRGRGGDRDRPRGDRDRDRPRSDRDRPRGDRNDRGGPIPLTRKTLDQRSGGGRSSTSDSAGRSRSGAGGSSRPPRSGGSGGEDRPRRSGRPAAATSSGGERSDGRRSSRGGNRSDRDAGPSGQRRPRSGGETRSRSSSSQRGGGSPRSRRSGSRDGSKSQGKASAPPSTGSMVKRVASLLFGSNGGGKKKTTRKR